MEDIHISNISDNIFFGSTPENVLVMDELKNRKISYFISLQQNQPEYTDKEHVLWLPTLNNGVPTFEQIEEGVAFITEKVKAGEKVYIHCRFGCGRAPTLVVAYLISTGMSPEDAMHKVYENRPIAHLNKDQEEVVREFGEMKGLLSGELEAI